MTKRLLLSLAAASMMIGAQAETNDNSIKLPDWVNSIKLSGYVITQYQASDQDGADNNSFNLRLGRVSLEGRVQNDWYWKVQMQVNGNTSTLGSSPRLVDAFVEWQKYDYAMVKVGQFKRAFTFENPMNPITQGFFSYGQNINKLAGMSDRNGQHASNGRDIGVQLQGDLVKNGNGRPIVHYQLGAYNGQGINLKDVDNKKDIIGGIWVMPVKGMRIGAFGWEGSYSRKGSWSDAQGQTHSGVRRLNQHRYAISGEYVVNDWTFRSEYIHSTGQAFKTTHNSSANASDCTINESLGNKADGVYALVLAPIIKKKLYAKARYDNYRPSGSWSDAKTYYEVGLNYSFNKNVQLNAEYLRVNDRSLVEHNYNMADVELSFKF